MLMTKNEKGTSDRCAQDGRLFKCLVKIAILAHNNNNVQI